jgi:site-specific DNA recombinase
MTGEVDQMPLRAGNVARVSKPKDRSISDQHNENAAEIQANGWLEVIRYADEMSASRFARRPREDWPRLVEDVEHDRLDVIVFWESSRGSRRLGEWIDFLDLCREHKVLIHSYVSRRTYDPADPRDRRTLIEDGVDAEWESEKTSERVHRGLRTNRDNRQQHGRVTWGYERIYDERTRRLLKQRPQDEVKAWPAEIIRRVASGEPVSAIRLDLDERHIPTPGTGQVVRKKGPDGEPVICSGEWSRRAITRIATDVAYIGKMRVDGELVDAGWPPVSDAPDFEDVFWAAQHLLTAPERKTTKPGKAKYLLSYLMACDVDGELLQPRLPYKREYVTKYKCTGNGTHPRISIPMADADEFVRLAVFRICSRPDFYKHLVSGSDARIVQARAEAARLRAELDEWASADISAHAYQIRESKLMPLINAAETRATELAVPLALRELTAPGADIAARWNAMPLAARREVVRALFPDLRLLPGHGPARDRIINRKQLDELADGLRG